MFETISLTLFDRYRNTGTIDENLSKSILKASGALKISVFNKDGSIINLTSAGDQPEVECVIGLDKFTEIDAIKAAFTTLLSGKGRILQLIAAVEGTDYRLSVVIRGDELHHTMVEFSWHFTMISLTIAFMAAILIYLIIYELLVRPMQDIYMNMLNFVIEPDNPSRILVPEARRDEVGIIQRRIAAIEGALQQNFVRQKHLADLGLAVSKINHDMRNVLASAQLMSDYLAEVKDPVVQRLAPKLVRTIDRAINYTQSIIAYGRAQEQPPQRRRLLLRRLVEDVQETLAVSGKEHVEIRNFVPEDFEINADNEQLHRIITNLCRNAVQVMTAPDNKRDCAIKQITITAGHIGTSAIIDVEDTGPGLSTKAKEHLFAPFQGSVTVSGLGLQSALSWCGRMAEPSSCWKMENRERILKFESRIFQSPS